MISGKDNWGYNRSCTFYDKQSKNWTSIAAMILGRENAACTVFEGKIIVSGGWFEYKNNTIEAYDYHENKWSYFPNMLSPRFNHTAISITNKMFMIGGRQDNFEVFDSVTRNFTYIKSVPKWI